MPSLAVALASLVLVVPVHVRLAAPPEAPPDTALTWRAWSPGLALQAHPVTSDEQFGASSERVLHARLPAEGGNWSVLIEGESGGDAWFAHAFLGVVAAPLLPVPAPLAGLTEAGVRLSWELPADLVPGLAGWQVLRLTTGREPELVGVVGAHATAFVDAPPPGEHEWALRPALPEGVSGPLGRASEPLIVSAPHQQRTRHEPDQP